MMKTIFQLLLHVFQVAHRMGLAVHVPYGLYKYAYPSLQLIKVDPKLIQWHAENNFIKSLPSFISSGDWDLSGYEISTSLRYARVSDIIQHDVDVKASKTFIEFMKCAEEGKPVLRHGVALKRETDILEYIHGIVSIYHSMLKDGYKSSGELGVDEGDICVGIGRDGKLVHLQTGHHRLALAQLANCTAISVRIMVIHTHWWKRHGGIYPAVTRMGYYGEG